jgi:hypothetical protein
MIMGCNADDDVQEIRVVCNNVDTEAAGCDHITKDGAVDTVVRLPENVSISSCSISEEGRTDEPSLRHFSVLQGSLRRR